MQKHHFLAKLMNSSNPPTYCFSVILWYLLPDRCNLIGVMQLDFALAYDELSSSTVQPCFDSSSRYHVGWDEKKKVISLSNHVIFALFMPRCWENIWKRTFNGKNDQPKVILYYCLPGFRNFIAGWFQRKLKTQQCWAILFCVVNP